jgi:hypothetical protein
MCLLCFLKGECHAIKEDVHFNVINVFLNMFGDRKAV